MKKLIISTSFIILFLLTGLVQVQAQEVVKETRNLPDFTSIKAENIVKVYLKQGKKQEVTVEVSAEYKENLVTEVKNNNLTVACRNLNMNEKNGQDVIFRVYITVPTIEKIEMHNATSMNIEDGFTFNKPITVELLNASVLKGDIKAKELNISTMNASKFDANISVDKAEFTAQNASKIAASGKAKTVNSKAQNVSKIDLEDLAIDNLVSSTADQFSKITVKEK